MTAFELPYCGESETDCVRMSSAPAAPSAAMTRFISLEFAARAARADRACSATPKERSARSGFTVTEAEPWTVTPVAVSPDTGSWMSATATESSEL